MMDSEIPMVEAPQPRRSAWYDLALYLVVGLGLFTAAQYLLRGQLQVNSIASSAILYTTNILAFAGTALGIGALRGRFSLAEIGFWPLRLPWKWILAGAMIAVVLIPLRVGLALAVQLTAGGGLGELENSMRMEIFSPGGSLLVNFLVTFVLGGLLVPVAEELYFRGAIFTWFRDRFGLWPSIIGSGLLFALGHADLLAVVVTSLVLGLVNAWLMERTRSIWVPVAVHITNNSLAILLLYGALALQQVIM
ncbi:MAG: CPBP family intramembrane metalloprotease [Chloroflexota bacterium]|nr:MAG: CPBP family intramembrane metalloprotease [Chloroflexota bacterium]